MYPRKHPNLFALAALLFATLTGSVHAQDGRTPPRAAPTRPPSRRRGAREAARRPGHAPCPGTARTHAEVRRDGGSDPAPPTTTARRKPHVAFIAYQMEGTDRLTRPVTFVFNGGPGMASGWLQVGAVGPWRISFGAANATHSAPPSRCRTPRRGSISPTWCSSTRRAPATPASSPWATPRVAGCGRSPATSTHWPR